MRYSTYFGTMMLGLLCATTAFGQDAGFSEKQARALLSSCLIDAEPTSAASVCGGYLYQACEATSDSTTLDMVSCADIATQAWDAQLNLDYDATLRWLAGMDENDIGPAGARVDALRAAQRIWITFRDAECLLAYTQAGSGSLRSIDNAFCKLDMTAVRTMQLRDMRAVY